MGINSREIFREAAPCVTLSAVGASVWWGMRNIGVANCPTFSPLGVGLAASVYLLVKKFAEPFFQRLLETNPAAPGYNRSICYFITELSSASAAVVTIYTVGILSLSVFTATSMIEIVLFLKGMEFFSTKMESLIQRMEGWLDSHFPNWSAPLPPPAEAPHPVDGAAPHPAGEAHPAHPGEQPAVAGH